MHHVELGTFLLHLLFDGAAALGGYYARGMCEHRAHRWTLTAVWSLFTTYMLVGIIG